jgi:cyclophilin family peptidyl-prolyl cis-trans isomerase
MNLLKYRSTVGALLLAALVWTLAVPAQAQQRTLVRIHTTQGPIDMRLYDTEAPISTANFLAYANAGDYGNVFFHRSVSNFVVQAGGYRWDPNSASCCQLVTSRGKITNEFSAGRSNLRGTVAMAKIGGDANSATSQWFFNLGNNSANLDSQNGGFTVFARLTTPSMAVVDRIAALPIVNAGGAFSELPLTGWTTGTPIQRSNLVLINKVTVFPAALGDTDRVLNYLEALYPLYLAPPEGAAGTADGYTYRYYSGSNAYVGVKDGKVWYLVPSIANEIRELGAFADLLAAADLAGY